MTDPYAPMRARAMTYEGSASWAYVLTVLAALWFGFQIIFSGLFIAWSGSIAVASDPSLNTELFNGSTPAAVAINLALFGIYTAILLVSMRGFHGLGLGALIGPLRSAWHDFARVSVFLLPLYALIVLPALVNPEAIQNLSVADWLSTLPLILPLLFVQISAEEFVFRGYLQSHLAALSTHPIVWIGIPSALFGMVHYDGTTAPYSAWAYVIWAMALGIVCADLTARTGNLGAALAVHFVNNIGALVILAADDWLYGAALFVWQTNGEPWDPWVLFEALFLGTVWLCARVAARR